MRALIYLKEGYMVYQIRTSLSTAQDALTEFKNALAHVGVNIEHINVQKVILKDENGNKISEYILN